MSALSPPTAAAQTATLAPNTTTDHEVTIAADNQQDEVSESEAETISLTSSTTSVTSSIFDYRVENGRTYHKYKEGKYAIPNNSREIERLDLQHNLFLHTFDGKLGTAPPNEPDAKVGRVLDVGTGTGIWAMEFGDEHPEAEVRGFDLSAVQPEFRMMNSSISNWDEYMKKCYNNLNPGGYLELNEVDIVVLSDDGSLKPEHSIMKTCGLLQGATANLGRAYQDIKDLKPIVMNAGFVDVTMQRFKWPTNSWPKEWRYKEIGMWNNENIHQGWEGICMAPLTRGLGWSQSEVLVLMAENRKEFNDRNIHAYFSIWSIYGKKPEEPTEAPEGSN